MKKQKKGAFTSTSSSPRVKKKSSRKNDESFAIVGIGASAGGLEAMTQLLKHLPGDAGMALVLVQHLDPTHESALTSILSRATLMPVVEAKNNMWLAGNHVYVIPPNKLMGVSSRRLKLFPRTDTDNLSIIDHFFRTLAEQEGARAIGVVLSGNGSDGTQGLSVIKAGGGITFSQDEKSAKYPSMPGSAITAGCVDFILPAEGIARELSRLSGHPYVMTSDADEGTRMEKPFEEKMFEEILTLLRQRSGVDFSNYKHATMRRRIHRRMALHKLESLKEYAKYLRAHAAEVKQLYDDILIHVTGFFRDAGVYQTLKKRILRRLIKNRAVGEAIRIWVPGCSTGEEAYSIAILMVELLADQKLHHPVQIFGTDINDSSLEKARAGLYPESIAADLSPDRLRRFFVKTDGGYRVNKSVRELCIFARQNLIVDPPFSNIDLISCRKVLIYLGPTLQRRVIPVFHYALRPDGFLLLGAAETVGSFADLFALFDKKAKLYAKKGMRSRPIVGFEHTAPGPVIPASPLPLPFARVEPALEDVQKHADHVLLTRFGPTGVIINKHMEVLQFRGRTGPYFEHAHGAASLNLLKMARV